MKLKTRITVGFMLVIVVPVILFSATIYGVTHMKSEQIQRAQASEQNYDIAIIDSTDQTAGATLMTKDIIFVVVTVLVFTSLLVGTWIYRSIAFPLVKLKNATKNIKEGNLDFELEVEVYDEFA